MCYMHTVGNECSRVTTAGGNIRGGRWLIQRSLRAVRRPRSAGACESWAHGKHERAHGSVYGCRVAPGHVYLSVSDPDRPPRLPSTRCSSRWSRYREDRVLGGLVSPAKPPRVAWKVSRNASLIVASQRNLFFRTRTFRLAFIDWKPSKRRSEDAESARQRGDEKRDPGYRGIARSGAKNKRSAGDARLEREEPVFANEGSFHGRRDAKRNLKMLTRATALSRDVSFVGSRRASQIDSLRGNNNRGKVRSGVTGHEQLIEPFLSRRSLGSLGISSGWNEERFPGGTSDRSTR